MCSWPNVAGARSGLDVATGDEIYCAATYCDGKVDDLAKGTALDGDRQVALLVDQRFNNGLPSNLVAVVPDSQRLDHGMKGLQLTMSAGTAEALASSNPSSVFSRSTECHNQDKVSMLT